MVLPRPILRLCGGGLPWDEAPLGSGIAPVLFRSRPGSLARDGAEWGTPTHAHCATACRLAVRHP